MQEVNKTVTEVAISMQEVAENTSSQQQVSGELEGVTTQLGGDMKTAMDDLHEAVQQSQKPLNSLLADHKNTWFRE